MLGFASSAGEILVLAFLLYRAVPRKLPWFFTLILWGLISDLALYYAASKFNSDAYYRISTISETVDSALQFGVLVELIWSVLRPVRSSLPRASFIILLGAFAIACLIIYPLAGQTIPANLAAQGKLGFHLEQTFAILRVIVFLAMASFSQILSIGWRDRELQAATGLGFYSIVSLIVAEMHTHQAVGPQYHRLDQVAAFSYLGTLTYWVLCFATKDRKRKEISKQMQDTLVLIGGTVRTARMSAQNVQGKPKEGRKP
jgi:hypothetical protein